MAGFPASAPLQGSVASLTCVATASAYFYLWPSPPSVVHGIFWVRTMQFCKCHVPCCGSVCCSNCVVVRVMLGSMIKCSTLLVWCKSNHISFHMRRMHFYCSRTTFYECRYIEHLITHLYYTDHTNLLYAFLTFVRSSDTHIHTWLIGPVHCCTSHTFCTVTDITA